MCSSGEGYRSDRMTFFVWEGVTQYIPEDAIRSTLRFVTTESAPGSSIVLDGKRKSFIDWVRANIASPEKVPQALRPTLANQKRLGDFGEPWIFGFPDGREREFFKSLGLDIGELLSQDGLSPSPIGWVAEALVPGVKRSHVGMPDGLVLLFGNAVTYFNSGFGDVIC